MNIEEGKANDDFMGGIGLIKLHILTAIAAILAGLFVCSAAQAATEAVLYAFKGGGDGIEPQGRIVDVNGTIYGITSFGGTNDAGTIFSLPISGGESIIYSFQGGQDGLNPIGGLLYVRGLLYGTTAAGGAHDYGTVFSTTISGAKTVLYSFKGGTDGNDPSTGLIKVGNRLYGTTDDGGSDKCAFLKNDCGVVFSMSFKGNEKVIYSFLGGNDGLLPQTSLINVDGVLYGTTAGGGDAACDQGFGCGTVYSVGLSGNETILHAFTGSPDGKQPEGVLLDSKGVMWGSTQVGGKKYWGTLFSITKAGNETVEHSFGRTPRGPVGNFVQVGDIFYGVSSGGGDYKCNRIRHDTIGCGTIFSFSRNGGVKVLYEFQGGADGAYPTNLIYANGTFYGTTLAGGGSANCSNGCGTVFALTP